MGKILVINGADFHENSVEVIPVYHNGSYSPNGNNYKNHFNKAPVNSATDWSAYNASYHTFSYPVKKGSVVSFGSNLVNSLYDVLLTETEGGYSEPIDYMTGQTMKVLKPRPNIASLLATEDGFLMVEYSPNTFPFPVDTLVTPYDQVSRDVSIDSPDFALANAYLKADGTYGNSYPQGGNASSFYRVFKNEVVTIKAQSDKVCVYALVDAFPSTANANPPLLSGQSRQTLSAGSSVSVTIPEDCMLYLWSWDTSTNYFPQEVSIARAEL